VGRGLPEPEPEEQAVDLRAAELPADGDRGGERRGEPVPNGLRLPRPGGGTAHRGEDRPARHRGTARLRGEALQDGRLTSPSGRGIIKTEKESLPVRRLA